MKHFEREVFSPTTVGALFLKRVIFFWKHNAGLVAVSFPRLRVVQTNLIQYYLATRFSKPQIQVVQKVSFVLQGRVLFERPQGLTWN